MNPWPQRVLLKTSFNPYSGYGNDGIGIAQEFGRHNYDVGLIPCIVVPPIPEDVAMLFTKKVQPPYNFLLNHLDPTALGLQYGEASVSPVRIAWTMWEFLGMGEAANIRQNIDGNPLDLRERLEQFTHLLVYDEVSKAALTPYVSEGTVVKKLQGGYWSEGWKANPQDRDWSGTYRFCMVGQLHNRKNPFAAVHAFDKLKKEHGKDFDAELHLKTNIRSLHPKMEERYPGLKIHYAAWSKPMLKEFYMQCHTYLAPSWGEGKNLPALEAQSTGCPVIATKFGGHAEWMQDSFSYPVRFSIAEHEPGMGSARADEDHLAELMWHVYTHRDEARRKGEIASQVIPAMCDWSKVIDRFGDLLREIGT